MAAQDDPGDVFCYVFVGGGGDEPPSRLKAASVPKRPLLLMLYCDIFDINGYISSARKLPIAPQVCRLTCFCEMSRPRGY